MEQPKLENPITNTEKVGQEQIHSLLFEEKLSWQERLKIASYLNSVAFNYDMNNPPRMDRTKFSTKSLKS